MGAYIRDQVLEMVGVIAYDISCDWSDEAITVSRMFHMCELLDSVGMDEYSVSLIKIWHDIIKDGRYIITHWDGPYGISTLDDVGESLYREYMDILVTRE